MHGSPTSSSKVTMNRNTPSYHLRDDFPLYFPGEPKCTFDLFIRFSGPNTSSTNDDGHVKHFRNTHFLLYSSFDRRFTVFSFFVLGGQTQIFGFPRNIRSTTMAVLSFFMIMSGIKSSPEASRIRGSISVIKPLSLATFWTIFITWLCLWILG